MLKIRICGSLPEVFDDLIPEGSPEIEIVDTDTALIDEGKVFVMFRHLIPPFSPSSDGVTKTGDTEITVRVPKPVEDVKAFLAGISVGPYVFESILGHESSRAVFERALGIAVPVNRKAIRLGPRDRLLVGQVVDEEGQPVRLPEGATELPEGVVLEWWLI